MIAYVYYREYHGSMHMITMSVIWSRARDSCNKCVYSVYATCNCYIILCIDNNIKKVIIIYKAVM